MYHSRERIKEIKYIANENLKMADNSSKNRTVVAKEKFWSLYRADIRELLCLIDDYESLLISVKKAYEKVKRIEKRNEN